MAGVCFSMHDELPGSVHDLMAMWGGVGTLRDASGCGMEKRLELDFRCAIVPGDVSVEGLESAMSHAGEVLERSSASGNIVSFYFGRSVVLLTASRIVVTCAPAVLLHLTLRPLLALLEVHGILVEWASFMRMNITSPWDAGDTSDVIAEEYAELKSAFPSGHPYLTGPIDRDHFFYFVYDAIDRGDMDVCLENDVQINIYMHNVKTLYGYDSNDGDMKNTWSVAPLLGSEYEMLRVCTDISGDPFVSFETNVAWASLHPTELLKSFFERFCPERLTMFLLLDRCNFVDHWRDAFQDIDGFTIINRAVNHFGEGYAFIQVVYTRV